jgi:hypothetical protein
LSTWLSISVTMVPSVISVMAELLCLHQPDC